MYPNIYVSRRSSARFALYQHEAFIISQSSKQVVVNDTLWQTRSKLEDATVGITDNLKELIQLKLGRYLPISMSVQTPLPK